MSRGPLRLRLVVLNGGVGFLILLALCTFVPVIGLGSEGSDKGDSGNKGIFKPSEANSAELVALLDDTEWEIELAPLHTAESEERITDRLRFKEKRITSDFFFKQGFGSTGFTVVIAEEGIPVWEATQLTRDKGIIFWRGELEKDMIRGLVSKHQLGVATESYLFSGKEIPRSGVPAEALPSAAQSDAPAGSPVETPGGSQ